MGVKLREGRTLARLRQSSWDKSRIAVGGRETDLQVWDLGRPEHAIFKAKNVRPDMLELRQEVWVSDIAWLCPNTVGICSKHGEIRRYDVREGGHKEDQFLSLSGLKSQRVKEGWLILL